MDASQFFPIRALGTVDSNDPGWTIEILHDHDGYGVGLRTAAPFMHLLPQEATRIGLNLLRAAAIATASQNVRARNN